MVSYKVAQDQTGQITLNIQMHVTVGKDASSNFACQFSPSSSERFEMEQLPPKFPHCTSILKDSTLPARGLPVTIKIRLGTTSVEERLNLLNCTNIRGPPTSVLCRKCIMAGCGWTANGCSWAKEGVGNDSVCQKMESWMNFSRPEISSITPSVVSFYGRNHAVLFGSNLSSVIGVRIQAAMDCTPQESPVWNNTGKHLTFHISSAENKGVVTVCVLLPDGSCHGSAKITYRSAPSCSSISPNSSWASGQRKITIQGSLLEFVEIIQHSGAPQEVTLSGNINYEPLQNLTYHSPAAGNTRGTFSSTLYLKVANKSLACSTGITYYPDPDFTTFSSTKTGYDVRITIQKKADKLGMTKEELSVWGIHEGKPHPCIMTEKDTHEETDYFLCEIQGTPITEFEEIMIQYGDQTVNLKLSLHLFVVMLLRFLLIPFIVVAVVIICWWHHKKHTPKMNKVGEDLELRQDFREASTGVSLL
ncbi:uncharacterized protein LOC117805110 [Notolabrus celidotus]|uniref:uncharacterized protein LOC117805110 n=1 Tax=Notolabrus celidotus TaxID=1203425 RepID=UPI00148F606C|nr:uncharacterized protein LOC117805110 [Notolabrus celidotus]